MNTTQRSRVPYPISIAARWKGSPFFHSVAVVASGTVVGQALTILVSPILTRLYSPSDLGVLTVYSGILLTLVAIGSLRYEMAIPLPDSDGEAVDLVVLAFGMLVLVSAVTAAFVWLFQAQIPQWLGTPGVRPFLWLVPIGLMGAGTYQILSFWAVRKKAFATLARTTLVQSVSQIAVQLGLGVAQLGPIGLLLGNIAGQVGGIGTIAKTLLAEHGNTIRNISPLRVAQTAQRYRKFPMWLSWSALLNTLSLQLPALLLAGFYGLTVAGWFALSERVARAPIRLVGVAVAQVYFSEASQTAKSDKGGLGRLFNKVTKQLLIFGGVPLLAVGLIAPWLFPIVFGPEWYEAGKILQVMIFAVVAQFVVSPLSQTSIVLGRQDLQFWSDLLRTTLVVAGFGISHYLGWSYMAAIGTYSMLMTATYVGFYFLYKFLVTHG